LLSVSVRGPNPQLAQELSQAIVEAFRAKWAADRRERADQAVSVFETRLRLAQEELIATSEELRREIAANPQLAALATSRGSGAQSRLPVLLATTDPRAALRLRDLELLEQEVDQLRTRLRQARLNSAAQLEAQTLPLWVADTARLPTRLSLDRGPVLFATAGGLTGLALSLGLLALLAAGDRSIRSADDSALPRTRPICAIPSFRPAGGAESAPGLSRRAVGRAAGTVLFDGT
jgi:uncharacterized protein involved in exopolysaccharide biosynthesis